MSAPLLLPFNSLCQACLSTEGSFRYCETRHTGDPNSGLEDVHRMGEKAAPHLHRECARCGYKWMEQTLGLSGGEPHDADATGQP